MKFRLQFSLVLLLASSIILHLCILHTTFASSDLPVIIEDANSDESNSGNMSDGEHDTDELSGEVSDGGNEAHEAQEEEEVDISMEIEDQQQDPNLELIKHIDDSSSPQVIVNKVIDSEMNGSVIVAALSRCLNLDSLLGFEMVLDVIGETCIDNVVGFHDLVVSIGDWDNYLSLFLNRHHCPAALLQSYITHSPSVPSINCLHTWRKHTMHMATSQSLQAWRLKIRSLGRYKMQMGLLLNWLQIAYELEHRPYSDTMVVHNHHSILGFLGRVNPKNKLCRLSLRMPDDNQQVRFRVEERRIYCLFGDLRRIDDTTVTITPSEPLTVISVHPESRSVTIRRHCLQPNTLVQVQSGSFVIYGPTGVFTLISDLALTGALMYTDGTSFQDDTITVLRMIAKENPTAPRTIVIGAGYIL